MDLTSDHTRLFELESERRPHRGEKRTRDEVEFEDWFLAHLEMLAQNGKPRTDRSQTFVGHCWPAANDYYSPLNPCFLVDFNGPATMNRRHVWMVRDGLIPLLWFLRSTPKPEGIRSRILVHDDFACFVPPAWRPQTRTYSLVSLRQRASALPGTPRRLLITGIGMDMYCSLSRVKALLASARAQYTDKELETLEIVSFLPGRFDGWGVEHKHAFFTSYVLEIAKSLGTRITPLDWSSFESFPSLEEFDLLELNEKYLVADSILSHAPLRRGARIIGQPLYDPKLPRHDEQLVRLSPFHGVRIQKITAKYALGQSARANGNTGVPRAFEEAFRSDLNTRIPWPKWFGDWARGITWN